MPGFKSPKRKTKYPISTDATGGILKDSIQRMNIYRRRKDNNNNSRVENDDDDEKLIFIGICLFVFFSSSCFSASLLHGVHVLRLIGACCICMRLAHKCSQSVSVFVFTLCTIMC